MLFASYFCTYLLVYCTTSIARDVKGSDIRKRLLLHTDSDIAGELLQLRSEVTVLKQQMSTLGSGQQNITQTVAGAVYVRWGRSSCSGNASLIYHGFIGGNHYNEPGSGTTNLCLPIDPTWANFKDGFNGYKAAIYGTEIDMLEPNHIFPYAVHNNDLPCAVCKSQKSTTMMIPARKNCYPGWLVEYTGYLVAGKNNLESSNYICLDSKPEFLQHGGSDDNQHILYPVEAHCGSLPCPPYVEGRELACVMCSM